MTQTCFSYLTVGIAKNRSIDCLINTVRRSEQHKSCKVARNRPPWRSAVLVLQWGSVHTMWWGQRLGGKIVGVMVKLSVSVSCRWW